jgi:outer membrane receptor protein involved in Fe transport
MIRTKGIVFAIFTLSTCAFSYAQLVQKQNTSLALDSAPVNKEDSIVTLDPFTVAPESDPQRAANTSAITAYSAPIKELPVQVQVFTPEFMESVGATDLYGALQYAAGTMVIPNTESSLSNPFGAIGVVQPNVSIRGQAATGASNVIKDGFKEILITDVAFISRVDLLEGPAGALYGEGNLGGAVAYSGPQPPKTKKVSFTQAIGSFDFKRSVFSIGGPITKDGKLSYILPISYQEGGNPEMWGHDRRIATNPTIVYKPKADTTLRFSYQYGDTDHSFTDSGFGMNNDSAAYGVSPSNRVLTSATNYILPSPNLRTFRWSGPDTFARQRAWSYELSFTKEFNPDLYFYTGYNYEEYHRKSRGYAISLQTGSNGTGANGMAAVAADPAYKALLRSDGAAVRYFPNEYYGDGYEVQPAWISNLYYHKKLSFVDASFVTGAYYSAYVQSQDKGRIRYMTSDSSSLSQDLNGITNATDINGNVVSIGPRISEQQALAWYRSPLDYTSVYHWSSFAGMPATPYPNYVVSKYFDKNIYVNSITKWFKNKLIANIGLLYIRDDRTSRVYRSSANPYGSNGSQVLPTDPDFYGFNTNPYAVFPANAHLLNGTLVAGRLVPVGAATPYYTTSASTISYAGNNQFNDSASFNTRRKPMKEASPSFSLSYMVTDDLNVYANGSSAMDPGPTYSGRDGNGTPIDAPIYKNTEVGLKYEAWHARIWFLADGYRTTSNNYESSVAWAFNNVNTTGFGAYIPETLRVEGMDLSLDMKVTDSLRLFPSWSVNQGQITTVGAFVAPNNQTPGILAVQQGTANVNANVYIGTNPFNLPKHLGRIRARYDFLTGMLKGLWIQPGMTYSSSVQVVAINNGSSTTNSSGVVVTTAPTYALTTLYSKTLINFDMGYEPPALKGRVRFIFNATNIGYNQEWYQVGTNGYFNAPPTYRFTTVFNF